MEAPHNLAVQPRSFVGRHRELDEFAQLLRTGKRLVTVLAPGGYGKSRVAAELCLKLLGSYRHGVFEVTLAPVRDPGRIATVTAGVLGLQLQDKADPEQQLVDFLREKELLLYFDNFEHLIDGASLLTAILDGAPRVQVIVTSRERLGLPGEHVYQLGALPVEAGDLAARAADHGPAMLLFTDRAGLVAPGFALTAKTTPLVQEICSALDGVPLAIELAAAWVDGFGLAELLAEMSEQLDLAARDPDVPERHRSVRASCDWSYKLLSGEQRLLTHCLATFKGGFFLSAAEAVIPVPGLAGGLSKLTDKCWLYAREVDGQTRYFMPDAAIHEYAFRKLLESDDFEVAVLAHCHYFGTLLMERAGQLRDAGQLEALRVLSLELENTFEALDTALRRADESMLLPFARHLYPYLIMVGEYRAAWRHYEMILQRATELKCAEAQLHGRLGLAHALLHLGHYEDARQDSLAAHDLARKLGDRRSLGLASNVLADVERLEGNHAAARSCYEESLAAMRESGDRPGTAEALRGLGLLESLTGNYDSARTLIKESLALLRRIGDRYGTASCLNELGNMEYREGDYAEARGFHGESLDIRRELGDRYGVAQSLNSLGNVEFSECNYSVAWSLYSESHAIRRDIGERFGIAASLNNLGNVEHCEGNYDDARRLHTEGLELKQEIGDRIGVSFSLNNLGNVSTKLGEHTRAAGELKDALEIARELGSKVCMLAPLAIGTALLAATGRLPAAATLLFGTLKQLELTGIAFDPMDGGMLEQGHHALNKALRPVELDELQSAAEAMTLDELVVYAVGALGELASAQDA